VRIFSERSPVLIWPGVRRDGGLLLFEFHFVEAGTQDAHGLGAIFLFGIFRPLRDDQAREQVGDAHGGICCVHRLTAGPEEQKVSMRRSLASILMSISSAWEGGDGGG